MPRTQVAMAWPTFPCHNAVEKSKPFTPDKTQNAFLRTLSGQCQPHPTQRDSSTALGQDVPDR